MIPKEFVALDLDYQYNLFVHRRSSFCCWRDLGQISFLKRRNVLIAEKNAPFISQNLLLFLFQYVIEIQGGKRRKVAGLIRYFCYHFCSTYYSSRSSNRHTETKADTLPGAPQKNVEVSRACATASTEHIQLLRAIWRSWCVRTRLRALAAASKE